METSKNVRQLFLRLQWQPRTHCRPMTTSTSTTVNVKKKKEKEGSILFGKLVRLGFGNTKESTVATVLDEWQSDGNPLPRPQLISYVTQLRRFHKPRLAIQLYQWMEEKKRTLSNADRAIRIDLLARTEGIESAEKYFNCLDECAKTKKTYGALLNCFCHGKLVDNANTLFDKMTKLDFHTTALNYNNMMGLYMKVGKPEMVPLLVQEMEEENIAPDLYSYNQLMNAYASLKNLGAAEGVLKTMKSKNIKYDWFTFGNLATIYFNAGLKDKSIAMLKKLEKSKNSKTPEAYHLLITLYSRMSVPDEVDRVWELCKSKFPKPSNISYLIMHLALSRLGNHDGLEKLFKEWESICSNYDIRISNIMLESYLERDMLEEASTLCDNATTRGVKPNLRTHNAFLNLCLRKGQIDLGLGCLKACAFEIHPQRDSWFPRQETVNAYMRHFNEEKDFDGLKKFHEIMKKFNRLPVDIAKVPDEKPPSLIHRLLAQFS